MSAIKTRIHGDLHLGQVLVLGSDVVLIGFGFEPTRASEARRTKHSPLKDVASLLHSLDRTAHSAGLKVTAERPEELPVLAPLVKGWKVDAKAALLAGYRDGIRDCRAWPSAPGDAERLLALFSIDNALLEVRNDLVSHYGSVVASLESLVVLIDELSGGEPWSTVQAQTADPSESGGR